jgi:hypothetical protein
MRKRKKLQSSTTFLAGLVNSEFSIINRSLLQDKINTRFSVLETQNVSLDLLMLQKSLKQLVRVLYFIRSKKDAKVLIYTDNIQTAKIFNRLLKKFPISKTKMKVLVFTDFLNVTFKGFRKRRLILLLGDKINTFANLKKLCSNRLFLFCKINAKTEKTLSGAYKILNSLNEFKKIVFIFSLLRKTLLINDKVKKAQ